MDASEARNSDGTSPNVSSFKCDCPGFFKSLSPAAQSGVKSIHEVPRRRRAGCGFDGASGVRATGFGSRWVFRPRRVGSSWRLCPRTKLSISSRRCSCAGQISCFSQSCFSWRGWPLRRGTPDAAERLRRIHQPRALCPGRIAYLRQARRRASSSALHFCIPVGIRLWGRRLSDSVDWAGLPRRSVSRRPGSG